MVIVLVENNLDILSLVNMRIYQHHHHKQNQHPIHFEQQIVVILQYKSDGNNDREKEDFIRINK